MDAPPVVALPLDGSPERRNRSIPIPQGPSLQESCQPAPCPADRPGLDAVDGLIFNLRNVLFDDTAWRRWLLRLVHHMGLHSHYEAFFRLWEREYLGEVRAGRVEYWDALGRFLLEAGMNRGQVMEVEAAGRSRRERFNHQTRPFPAVGLTLARLHQAGLQLAVVEPGGGELANPLQPLRDGNLERWFHAVIPEDTQFVVPGTDIPDFAAVSSLNLELDSEQLAASRKYHDALVQLRLPANRVALVGQDPQELTAAASLGIRTIAFNAGREVQARCHLDQFADLLPLCGVAHSRRLAG